MLHNDRAKKTLRFVCTLMFLAACLCGRVRADSSVTLTFDELAFQSVDGLSHGGVMFGFQIAGVDSTEAFYNSFGPGSLTYVSDPSLTGDSAGILTLEFEMLVNFLQFGVALNTGDALSPGLSLELFGANYESLEIVTVDTDPATGDLGFTEAQFLYSGAPVSRAVIDFDYEPGSFAIDNLTFLVVPEPSGLVSILFAVLLIGIRIR